MLQFKVSAQGRTLKFSKANKGHGTWHCSNKIGAKHSGHTSHDLTAEKDGQGEAGQLH